MCERWIHETPRVPQFHEQTFHRRIPLVRFPAVIWPGVRQATGPLLSPVHLAFADLLADGFHSRFGGIVHTLNATAIDHQLLASVK